MKNIFFIIFLSVIFFAALASAQNTEFFVAPELSLPIVIGLGLIDSVNPCVIGVLILLMTILLKSGNRNKVLINGFTYVGAVYFTYLLGGLTLLGIFNSVREISFISQILYVVIGAFVIVAGLLEVKDFFWYGKWYSLAIPHSLVKTVESRAATAPASLAATFTAGVVLTLIELPCTGAPYLAVLTLMSQGGYSYITALPLLLLYNLVFVLPLLIVIFVVYRGTNLKMVEGLRQEHRGKMRLLIGLALLAIGLWIFSAVTSHWVTALYLIIGVIVLMAIVKYVLHWWEE